MVQGVISLRRIGRVQIFGEEFVNLDARFLRQFRVDSVERVASGGVGVNLVFKSLSRGFERLHQMLNLQYIDVLVVGGGVNEQRRLQLLRVPRGRTPAILVHIVFSRLAKVIGSGK